MKTQLALGVKRNLRIAPGVSRGIKDELRDLSPLKAGVRLKLELLRPPFGGLEIMTISLTHGLRRGLQ